MGFEKYKPTHCHSSNVPQVSINKTGTITFNAAFKRELPRPKTADLFFDKDSSMVRIVFHVNTEGSFKITDAKSTMVFSGAGFVNHYGIDTSEVQRWHIERPKAGIIVFGPVKMRQGER